MGKKPDSRKPAGAKKAWLIAGGAVVVAAAAYGAAGVALAGQVPAGTTVHGVDISGLSAGEAQIRLQDELLAVAGQEVEVAAGGRVAAFTPEEAGLGLDIPATLDGQTGFTLNPAVLWHRVAGGGALEPVLVHDDARLQQAVTAAAESLNADPVEGSLRFKRAEPVLEQPEPGTSVRVDEAVEVVAERWFGAAEPLDLPADAPEPRTPASAFEAARTGQAEPLVAGPVTVAAGDLEAVLEPAQLAAAASFAVDGDRVDLRLDRGKLLEAVLDANPKLGSTAKDARIVLRGGRPAVEPSVTGRGIDAEGLEAKVLTAVGSGERTATVDMVETQPDLTTAEAKALGVKEVVAEFSTPYPTSDTVRTRNLRAGAAKLNGVVVMPGETFSATGVLAPITEANGYFDSGVVVDGFSSSAIGGGLSQISTQMFNIGFLAGMDDIEHQPHSRWFERYPAGRESTLWEGSIDVKWRNNTGHAALIQAWVGPDRVYSRLWSTKVWNVKTTTSEHYNLKNPTTEYNTADDCVAESGGKKGFTVKVTRSRSSATQTLPTETLTWTYRPWNKVVCGPKP